MKKKMIVLMVIFVTGLLTSQASSDLKNLTEANNVFYFPLEIYKSLLPTENLFFCPASVFTALEMLLQGAGGNTAEEIREVLYYPTAELTNENLHQKFKDFVELVGKSSKDYTLEIANAIAPSVEFVISAKYEDYLKSHYNATIIPVDFRDKVAALNEINGWVSEETHGIIPKLLEDVSSDTVVVLLNAVYFNGTWEYEFNPNLTKDDVFYAYGTDPIKVGMMNETNYFSYEEFEEDNFKALKLPYKGEQLSMVVLLPNEKDGWKDLEESLTPQKLAVIFSSLDHGEQKVAVSIPKFKVEYGRKLVENLKKLGMKDAFNAKRADFTGISSTPGLHVTDVVHKTVIEVNEKGTNAAGATTVVVGPLSDKTTLQYEFKADHPFLFLIYHEITGMILFMGRLTEP